MNKKPHTTPEASAILSTAILEWRHDKPYSQQFDDIYFSPEDGPAETDYVFIQQNQLAQRWRELISDESFTIGETGFGSGLNFLCAANLWLSIAPPTAQLHYVSTEHYPLHHSDLNRVLASWIDLDTPASQNNKTGDDTSNHLSKLARELGESYPPPLPGFHRIELAKGRIHLSLLYGDAAHQLDELQASDHPLFINLPTQSQPYGVDAWFLDGFAPAKNPEMWSPALFSIIANLSKPGTSFSTFTAAGNVRRELTRVGFDVEKIKGYGSKREMLRGNFVKQTRTETTTDEKKNNPYTPVKRNSTHTPPWHLKLSNNSSRSGDKCAAVIGAGIAGCTTANALAQRGWKISLYDPNGIASGASGNPQGVLYPKLSIEASSFSRINLAAMRYASYFYQRLSTKICHTNPQFQTSPNTSTSGVLLLPANPKETQKFLQIAECYRQTPEFVRLLGRKEMEQISGVPLTADSGLLFPQLGWVRPTDICQQLTQHPNITLIGNTITALQWHKTKQYWVLNTESGSEIHHATVVLANAADIQQFDITQHLPLNTIRGQISICPATQESQKLNTVICGEAYLAPVSHGFHTLGASYELSQKDTLVREAEHHSNLEKIRSTDTQLAEVLAPLDTFTGRAALRCVTPDYLPLAGPAPIYDDFLNDFALLRENARAHIPRAGSYWPNLYINCGHGSRGLSYAPLCAQIIANHLEHTPPPLERSLLTALNPARFIIRDLKRGLV